ncbi:MAG TPA: CBASS cGAMP-activated phospholipase [Fusibacter sp.]|nr:CBASS cGAMP-activated phospholipase [Fusibacter sp.]
MIAEKFKILSIDGGGFRGAYSAHILKRIEEEFHIHWKNDFNLIAGTSTGSIIAAGLAFGMSAKELFDFYEKYGKNIFKKRFLPRTGLFTSQHCQHKLKEILDSVFGDTRLKDIEVPLIIPSTDIGNGCVHVFKSAYHDEFVRDPNVKVADAVLASCSAPTYFDPHLVDNKYLLCDGGLWANNPALVAMIDAKKRLDIRMEDLLILSLGTGIGKQYYSPNKKKKSFFGWGFITKWERNKFIDMILNLQAENSTNMLKLLLQDGQLLRINFEADRKLSLDDPSRLADWVSKADHDFTHNYIDIAKFLKLKKKER